MILFGLLLSLLHLPSGFPLYSPPNRPKFLIPIDDSICPRGKGHSTAMVHYYDYPKLMLLDAKRRIIMDWSPKSACTRMVEMFWNEMGIKRGVHYPATSPIGPLANYYRPDFYRVCGVVTTAMMHDEKYYKFKVVRNPYTRAVSSYLHVMDKNVTHMMNTSGLFRVKNGIWKDEHHPLNFLSFENFLSWYLKEVRDLALKGTFRGAALHHFMGQASDDEIQRFKSGKPTLYNRIVHVENFDVEIAQVNKDEGTRFSYPVGYDAHERVKRIHEDVYHGNWPYNLLRDNAPENYGTFYNTRTKEMVAEIFAHDLMIYNYSFPFNKLYIN